MQSFYTAGELQSLVALKGTVRDIELRMPVKITRHYFEQAKNSKPLQTLVKASPKETYDLAGAPDPGKQMDYSPVEGLIQKYELGLIYVATACSAHCRFCYREELIAGKEVERPDGTVAPKGLAQIGDIIAYIREHNGLVLKNGGIHPDTGREKLREILMSGGDPMVLSNRNIAAWLAALARAGIESIRIGTKELAFYPDRFDRAFFAMLNKFHDIYPETNLRMMVHFNPLAQRPHQQQAGFRLRYLSRSRHLIGYHGQPEIPDDSVGNADCVKQQSLTALGLEVCDLMITVCRFPPDQNSGGRTSTSRLPCIAVAARSVLLR